MVYWIAVTALATVGILILAWSNYNLAKEIKETRDTHDEEIKDLFQAMVIAQLIGGASIELEKHKVKLFKRYYTGKIVTLVWKDEKA